MASQENLQNFARGKRVVLKKKTTFKIPNNFASQSSPQASGSGPDKLDQPCVEEVPAKDVNFENLTD